MASVSQVASAGVKYGKTQKDEGSQTTVEQKIGFCITSDGVRIAYLVGAFAPANCTSGTQIFVALPTVSFSMTLLTGGTQYSFRVCAVNANPTPDESPGLTASGTTPLQPFPPDPIAPPFATPISTSQIDLAWTSGGGSTTDFRIAYDPGAVAPVDCVSGTPISELAIN